MNTLRPRHDPRPPSSPAPPPGVVASSTCPYCGAPRACCLGGVPARTAGATGHGGGAEGEEGGDAPECGTEAESGTP